MVKRLKIKNVLQTHSKYKPTNGEKSWALGIAHNIIIEVLDKILKINAIVYDHKAFSLLLRRRTLKRSRVITDWDTSKWYIIVNTGKRTQIPINHNMGFGVRRISDNQLTDSTSLSDYTSEMDEVSDSEPRILASQPEIYCFTDETKDIYKALRTFKF